MPGLKVFVSSTCYDLSVIRSQLRLFIQSLGHIPIMSDYCDILYNPGLHTHTSCIDEVMSADMLIVIIGSRYGGQSVPEAISRVNLNEFSSESRSTDITKKIDKISITQLEVLKAIEMQIPVYTFIVSDVWHDHRLYEKNKKANISDKIEYPSIEKTETAKYVFEFINLLRHRVKGNSVYSFEKIQDIEQILRKQWSLYFQRLLMDKRNSYHERKRIDKLTSQFEDLKTAILATIGSSIDPEVARGAVKYRKLFDFVRSIAPDELDFAYMKELKWNEMLKICEITQIVNANDFIQEQTIALSNRIRLKFKTILIKEDKTFFSAKYSVDIINKLKYDWESFITINREARKIIVLALTEMSEATEIVTYHDISPRVYFERLVDYRESFDDNIRVHFDQHTDEE